MHDIMTVSSSICGAHLLHVARIISHVQGTLDLPDCETYMYMYEWMASTIVLSWLAGDPSQVQALRSKQGDPHSVVYSIQKVDTGEWIRQLG